MTSMAQRQELQAQIWKIAEVLALITKEKLNTEEVKHYITISRQPEYISENSMQLITCQSKIYLKLKNVLK
jgi:hypothetical protein